MLLDVFAHLRNTITLKVAQRVGACKHLGYLHCIGAWLHRGRDHDRTLVRIRIVHRRSRIHNVGGRKREKRYESFSAPMRTVQELLRRRNALQNDGRVDASGPPLIGCTGWRITASALRHPIRVTFQGSVSWMGNYGGLGVYARRQSLLLSSRLSLEQAQRPNWNSYRSLSFQG